MSKPFFSINAFLIGPLFSGPDDFGGSLEAKRKVSDIRRPEGFSGHVGQELLRSHAEESAADGAKGESRADAQREPRLSDGDRKTNVAGVRARGHGPVLSSVHPGVGVLQDQRRVAGKIRRRVQAFVHQPPESQGFVRANILPRPVELSRHHRGGSLRMRGRTGLPTAPLVVYGTRPKRPSKPLSELRIIFTFYETIDIFRFFLIPF